MCHNESSLSVQGSAFSDMATRVELILTPCSIDPIPIAFDIEGTRPGGLTNGECASEEKIKEAINNSTLIIVVKEEFFNITSFAAEPL